VTHRRLSLGKTGEDLAVRHLRALGYRVLERNFRCALGEIDLIAREGDCLVFVEIKTRRGGPMGEAKAAVDERKQRRISRVALRYLKERGQTEARSRFDVVAVIVEGDRHRMELVRDAFEAVF
jgi:putative endonuclease